MVKKRKLTDEERKRIWDLWNRGRPLDVLNRGLSDSLWISKETGIPERSVRATIANFPRRSDAAKSKEKREVERVLLEALRPEEVFAGTTTISTWIAQQTGICEKSVSAYVANLNRSKNRLLIIDNTFESIENKSESRYLKEMIRIYDWNGAIKSRIAPVKSKTGFLEELKKAKEWYIHISAHGKTGKSVGTRIRAGQSWITPKDIYDDKLAGKNKNKLWSGRGRDDKPLLILAAACEAGQKDLAEAFHKAGCRYFIAPSQEVPWINVAIFSTLFYYHLFVQRLSAREAFRETKKLLSRVPTLDERVWVIHEKSRRKASAE